MKRNCCNICGRSLDNESDPLSRDCAGDCWGCIGEMEADSGYEPSLSIVRAEFEEGLRMNWIPSPNIDVSRVGNGITVSIRFQRPLSEPWIGVDTDIRLSNSPDASAIGLIFYKSNQISDLNGLVTVTLAKSPTSMPIWLHIHRASSIWSFPINCDA